MKLKTLALAALAFITLSSCVKEKLENTYNNQEDRIDQFIEKNRYVKTTVDGVAKTDTLRVVYNGGSTRLVTKEKLLANLLLVVVRSSRRGDNRVKIC